MTQKGALKGKLPYMSPEQAWGKAIDSRSDIFSAGTLLFEMLTGQRLFDGESELAVLEAVRDCEVGARLDEHPDIPSPVRAVLLKALAADPDSRYQLAGDLQSEIEEILRRMDSKPGDSQLAAFIQELQQTEEEVVEEPPPLPDLSPLEQLTRPVDPHQTGDLPLVDLEPPSTTHDASDEGPRAWTRWLPWSVAAVFLGVALAAAAWWSLGTLRQPTASDSGLYSIDVGPLSIRPPHQTGGAFHATDRSRARQASAPPSEASESEPQPGPEAPPSEPPTIPSEPTADPQSFGGDAELQRQFEAELQKVEELLAASPLNGSPSDDSVAPTEETVVPPQPEPEAAPGAPATEETAADTSRPQPQASETSENSPARPGEEAETMAPVVGPEPAAESSPLEPVEDAALPEPEVQQATETTNTATQASKLPPLSPTTSDIAAPSTSSAIPPPGVTKTQPTQITTTAPDPGPRPLVRTGDLVEPGPGVVPPAPLEIVRPEYPLLARRLRIQGRVRMSVLVDETGRVVETRLLEGVKQKVGINEAALAAAAKSSFRPATKDGVRVKMWYEMVTRFEQ